MDAMGEFVRALMEKMGTTGMLSFEVGIAVGELRADGWRVYPPEGMPAIRREEAEDEDDTTREIPVVESRPDERPEDALLDGIVEWVEEFGPVDTSQVQAKFTEGGFSSEAVSRALSMLVRDGRRIVRRGTQLTKVPPEAEE